MVKAPSLLCRERSKYTPDKRGIEVLTLKEVHRLGCLVLESRPVVTMAGVSQMLNGGRMAEWLRPRVFIAEIGLNIRRISVGSKSCPSRKSIGWAVDVKITPRCYYGRRKPIFKGAGWPSG